ncbi:MAG: TonB-dependent siderophore receptor [Pseudomonadota bacterium]
MRNILFLHIILGFIAISLPASAQETANDEIDEIIVIGKPSKFGATKSEIPIMETPRSVSVITADEFLSKGALTLSDTLNYTAGVTSDAFGYATRGDFTSIRGLDAPEYQDNLQVLFGFYNNARADVYTLEQIEILKGPASVLYGQAAPGGIASTVSKVAGPEHLGRELIFTAGNHSRYQASFDAGFDLTGDSRWTARLVGLYRDSETQVDFVTDDAIVLAPSITFANEDSTFTALLNYTDRESDTSAQFLPLTATACGTADVTVSEANVCAGTTGQEVDHSVYVGDPGFNRYDTEATTFSLFGTHDFSDTLSFAATARYRDNEAQYDQTWVSFLGDGNPRLLPDGSAVGRSWSSAPASSTQIAFDARLRTVFDTGPITHELLIGMNYQDVETSENSSFLYARATTFNIFNPVYDGSEIPTAAEFDAQRFLAEDKTTAKDIYLTDHMTIGNLVASAGIRFSSVNSKDNLTNQEDDETPITLGLLYKTDIGLNPYASYSESFRATVGTDILTARSLLPRRGEQTEFGVKYQPLNGDSYITIAWFDLEEDNLVEFVPGGRTQPGLTIETEGFEIEALLKWRDWSFDFDYRDLDANDVDEMGVAVVRPSLPETAASLWTTWTPSSGALNGLRIGIGARYASENESNGVAFLPANGFAPTPNRVVTDGYTVIDALIGYRFERVDVALNIRNAADKEYYATCLSRGDCFPGEQRTVVGTVAWRF